MTGFAVVAAVLAVLAATCLAGLMARLSARLALRGRVGVLSGGQRPSAGWRVRLHRPRRGPTAGDDRLPLATELLAACLAAGAAPGEAAAAVGSALGGQVGEGLRRAAAELRLGGDPATAWGRFGQLPGAARLARRLELADTSGAPVARVVAAEAAQSRARQLRASQLRARRAAVYATGPLGLCFLPAFLLLGVAPVVLGLARELL